MKKFSVIIFVSLFYLQGLYAIECTHLFEEHTFSDKGHKVYKSLARYSNLRNLSTYLSSHNRKAILNNRTLDKKDYEKMLLTVYQKIEEMLFAQEIQFQVITLDTRNEDNHFVSFKNYHAFQIKPNDKTDLGKLALSLSKMKTPYKLVIDPTLELFRGAHGELDKDARNMSLSMSYIEKRDYYDTAIVYHELRHLLFVENMNKHKLARLSIDSINSHFFSLDPVYRSSVFFDEILAYFETIRFMNLFLSKTSRYRESGGREALTNTIDANKQLLTISEFFIVRIENLIRITKNLSTDKIKKSISESYLGDTKTSQFVFKNSSSEYTMDLIILNGSPKKTILLELEKLLLYAKHYYEIAFFVDEKLKSIENIYSEKNYYKIRALQSVFRRWNTQYSDNEPITQEKIKELYGRALLDITERKN